MSLTIKRVLPSQRRRLSELGYTNDDIKDLQQNPQKLNQIIEKGTVKTGATDLQIQREEKLKLKNQKILKTLQEKSKTLDKKWTKNLKIFNATNDTNYTLDDFKNAKLVNEGGYGRSSTYKIKGKNYTFGSSGALQFDNYLNHNSKVSKFQKDNKLTFDTIEEEEVKPPLKGLNLTIPTSVQQEVEKVDTQIKIEDTKANNQVNSEIPVSKDNNPIINGEIAQIASAGGIGGLGIGPKTNNDQLTIKNESKPETTVKKNTNALGINRKEWALMTKPQRKAARLSIK